MYQNSKHVPPLCATNLCSTTGGKLSSVLRPDLEISDRAVECVEKFGKCLRKKSRGDDIAIQWLGNT